MGMGGTTQTQAAAGGGVSGIGSIVGSIIGGLFSAKGQKDANAANRALAKENRDWQERMSNTAYQRAATDLSAAGLNRILAFGSPATTPGGNVATMGNVGEKGVAGAMQGAQIALMGAQTAKAKAEADKIRSTTNIQGPAARAGSVLSNAIDKLKGAIGNFRGNVEPKIVEGVSNSAKTFAYGAKRHLRGKSVGNWADKRTWQKKLADWHENEKKKGRSPSYAETEKKGKEYLENEIGLQERR